MEAKLIYVLPPRMISGPADEERDRTSRSSLSFFRSCMCCSNIFQIVAYFHGLGLLVLQVVSFGMLFAASISRRKESCRGRQSEAAASRSALIKELCSAGSCIDIIPCDNFCIVAGAGRYFFDGGGIMALAAYFG